MSYNLRSRTINKNISVPVVAKKKTAKAGTAITEQKEDEIREISIDKINEVVSKLFGNNVRRSERIAAKKTYTNTDDIITEKETNLFGMKRRY